MLRVAGADPGTTSLDLLILEDGRVIDQARFPASDIQADPNSPVNWLSQRGPFDLIAGPSGFGLPLIRASECSERELALMNLVRPDDQGPRQGVPRFSRLVRAFQKSSLPVVFLPGVIHLATVPAYRKTNRVDMGTADKLAVGALALERLGARLHQDWSTCNCCVVELGSAFSACMVLSQGQIVDGLGGTSGPMGWRSGGAWDGEAAYLLSPLSKTDLFSGGVTAAAKTDDARLFLRESILKSVAGLRVVTPFDEIVLSGQLLETEPTFVGELAAYLQRLCPVRILDSLVGAWVKHAAQGAALLADGLAGGKHANLVDHLQLRQAAGTVLDWLTYPRGDDLRNTFNLTNSGHA